MDDVISQLRREYERHDQWAAGPVLHVEERWYHEGARDGIMLALVLLETRPLRFVVETE